MTRIARKWKEFSRYLPLARGWRDRAALLRLALVRSRLLHAPTREDVITPRLRAAEQRKVRIDLANAAQLDVFDELFLDGIYDLDAIPFTPDAILDCGAYCGYFSLIAAARFPKARLTCFEPGAANIALVRRQFAEADIAGEVVQAAVSVFDGEGNFQGSGFGGALVAAEAPDGTTVSVVNLERIIRNSDSHRLLLKLDVEGEEKKVLPAILAALPASTFIFLETHYDVPATHALLQPYREAGFSVNEVRRRADPDNPRHFIEWRLCREQADG